MQETASLVVLAGTRTRFVDTVECAQVLRVGDRASRELPAHLTSGGRAILALHDQAEVAERYADDPDVDLLQLGRQLALVRRAGFAINHQKTEAGLTAVAAAVRDPHGAPVGAIAIAMPSVRFHRDRLDGWVAAFGAASRAVEADLA